MMSTPLSGPGGGDLAVEAQHREDLGHQVRQIRLAQHRRHVCSDSIAGSTSDRPGPQVGFIASICNFAQKLVAHLPGLAK